MEAIVADLSNITFKIEHTLNRQIGIGGLMFAGMDSMSNQSYCVLAARILCPDYHCVHDSADKWRNSGCS
jgi:hypothetical protein